MFWDTYETILDSNKLNLETSSSGVLWRLCTSKHTETGTYMSGEIIEADHHHQDHGGHGDLGRHHV